MILSTLHFIWKASTNWPSLAITTVARQPNSPLQRLQLNHAKGGYTNIPYVVCMWYVVVTARLNSVSYYWGTCHWTPLLSHTCCSHSRANSRNIGWGGGGGLLVFLCLCFSKSCTLYFKQKKTNKQKTPSTLSIIVWNKCHYLFL